MKSRAMWIRAMLCLALVALLCGPHEVLPVALAAEPIDVSLVQLIANPREFHGRLVRVKGFCHLEFEGNGLYLHREDSELFISRNGVWLDVGYPVPEHQQVLSDQYVLVEAEFDADCGGHLGAWSGCLRAVRRMEKLLTREELHKGSPPPE